MNERPRPCRSLVPVLCVLALAGAAPSAIADGQPLAWRVHGEANTLYLLGSIHLLRPDDYPLPERVSRLYESADALVMELDMDDLDPTALSMALLAGGRYGDGGSLAAALGDEYAAAAARAAEIGVDLAMLDALEPWLAALTVTQIRLVQLGFQPGSGLEMHLLERAAADAKPILGLETVDEQVDVFDTLPPEVQLEFLLQSLDEALEIGPLMDDIVVAWRQGDERALEADLLEDLRAAPEVYERLVGERNARWVERLVALFGDDEDYLVVVGALHLVGDEGVPVLLERRGVEIEALD